MRGIVMRARLLIASFAATPVVAIFGLVVHHDVPGSTVLPQETGSQADNGQGVSPRPTPPPSPLQYSDLFKRLTGFTMGPDTCGYVATDWDDAFTCVRVGASCTNDGTFIGCCTNAGTDCFSTMKTACIDYSASLSGACNDITGSHTLCCNTNAFGMCHTYTFSTTASPGRILTLVGCDSVTGTDRLLDYPPTATRSTRSTSSTTSDTSTSGLTSSSSSATSSSSSAAATPIASSSPIPSPTPVGAIVGGIVGGIAGVGLVVLAALYLWRRSKDRKDGPVGGSGGQLPPPHHPPSMMQTQPATGLPPMTAGDDGHYHYPHSYQPTPSTMYASQTTPPQQGLAYAVPDPGHAAEVYGNAPLQQAGWGVAASVPEQQQPGRYSYQEVQKGYGDNVSQQQQPYQYEARTAQTPYGGPT